ncbi:hypothetical protein PINS_up007355 [Pythium insidiosum]|nr:hypothetical protein PINS_up007355 [Pythium insidiosum]
MSESQDSEAFLRLGSPASSPEDSDDTGEVRYYGRPSTVSITDGPATPTVATLSIAELEECVKHNASDVDAWLMLALRHLELRAMSEEPSSLIEHLLALSDLFDGIDSRVALPSRANVEQSLHTLARALEVESNAYCDVLWWLHLRLGAFFRHAFGVSLETETGEQDAKTLEMEQVEQALEFVPTSVALWRHYFSLLDVGTSLEDATGSMLRLLQHLTTLFEQIADNETRRAMRSLLCDLVLHVCSLYCIAGAESKADNLLTQLVAAEADNAWHVDVMNCLGSRERVALVLVFVHVSLTGEVPVMVSSRGLHDHDPMELEEIEALCVRSVHAATSLCRLERALDVCEAAMQAADSVDSDDRHALETLGVVCVALARRIRELDSATERLATLLNREMKRQQPFVRVLANLASQTNAVWPAALQTTGVLLTQAVHLFLLHHSNLFSPNGDNVDEAGSDGVLPSLSELVAVLAQCLEVDLNELSTLSSPVDALSMLATRALARLVASPTAEATYALVSVLQLLNQVTQRHERSLRCLDELLSKTRSLPRQSQELLHALRVVWQFESLAASDENVDVMAVTLATIRHAVTALAPSTRHRERLAYALRIRQDTESSSSLSTTLRLVLAPQSESKQRVPRILMELVHLALHALPSHERERFLTTLLHEKPYILPRLLAS